jgi:DNA-binding NtrC family response regulator
MSTKVEQEKTRTLLIIDSCQKCEDLLPALKACGWRIQACSINNVTHGQADVGLVRLSNGGPVYLQQLKQLIVHSEIEWIAVVVPEMLLKPEIANFISEWFFDFHTLPFDRNRVEIALGRAFGMARLRNQTHYATHTVDLDFLGSSPQATNLRQLIDKMAPTEPPVLIRGESGTGKELVARALHKKSPRANAPFVAINCGAIPVHLIQSELFGHEKGAFTGAHQRKIGRIESAQGGTLFLDEIGDLPLDLQANLLRFLQERKIDRVGGSEPVPVDVRILAATHVDLDEAISRGQFREDLYYRLNVLEIHTAPLRERKSDIIILAKHFARLYANEAGRKPRRFSAETFAAMNLYRWPGNVRELANRVRRGMVMAEGRQIEPQNLGLTMATETTNTPLTLREQIMTIEKIALEQALAEHPHNMKQVAESLDVSRPTLYRLLHKHQMIGADAAVD